jgi:hypothetical protein
MERLLADAETSLPRLHFGFLDAIHLNKPIELLLVAPVSAEIVVPNGASERVDHDGILPAGELDDQARGRAAVEPCGTLNRFRETESVAGRCDGSRIVDFALNLNDVRHLRISLFGEPVQITRSSARDHGRRKIGRRATSN